MDSSEWKYLRRIHSLKGVVAEPTVHKRPDGSPEIFVPANETLSIPFVFQTFATNNVPVHVINVSFLNSKRLPVALIDLRIIPHGFYINKSWHLFKGENETIRKTLLYSPNSLVKGDVNTGKKYSIRSDKDQVVSSTIIDSKNHIGFKQVTFKLRVGSFAPESKQIHLLIYHDAYCTNLDEIWQIHVYSLYRLDVNCVLGQTNSASMILRGGNQASLVKMYPSRPEEVLVTSPLPLLLPAHGNYYCLYFQTGLAEVELLLRPDEGESIGNILNVVGKLSS